MINQEGEAAGGVPRVVHYCWFGCNPKPPAVERFIRNWREVLPDYEIREWNEENFDIEAWPYASQAQAAKRYAFVSDVARLHALYTCGGVYLDTDVEVRRPFDHLMNGGVVLGFEEGDYVATSTMLAPPGAKLVGDFLECYSSRSFLQADGTLDQTTNVEILTAMLETAGLKKNGAPQDLLWSGEEVHVLDRVKFSPLDYPNGICYADQTTYAIHHFGQSWGSPMAKGKAMIRKVLIQLIGGERVKRLRKMMAPRKRVPQINEDAQK